MSTVVFCAQEIEGDGLSPSISSTFNFDNDWECTSARTIEQSVDSASVTGETLVDSIPKLDDISKDDNAFAKSIKVVLTIDDPTRQYEPGNTIHGSAHIENSGDVDVDYKFLCISFEGRLLNPKQTKNFLQIIDLNCQPVKVAPVVRSGSSRDLPVSFDIPYRLLDNECPHDLMSHLNLPPSVDSKGARVFGFSNTDLNYCVSVRLVGRGADYGVVSRGPSEYVILRGDTKRIDIIPTEVKNLPLATQNGMLHDLLARIDKKLQMAHEVSKVLGGRNLEGIEDLVGSIEEVIKCSSKGSQSYSTAPIPVVGESNHKKVIELKSVFVRPFFKKIEMLLQTPNTVYCIPYQRNLHEILTIPLSLKSNSPVKLKSIRVSLGILSIRSDVYPIPLEINHDMMFKNTNPPITNDTDTFSHHIISVFRAKYHEVRDAIQEMGAENFKIEQELVNSIRSMAMLKDKMVELPLCSPVLTQNEQPVSTIAWTKVDNAYHCDVEVTVDFAGVNSKQLQSMFKRIQLLPNFQYCHESRLYYLKVVLDFGDNTFVAKLPLSIIN
ncbi:ubiquitin ligase-binding protein bul1 [Yamadazyma tenuis]|uniref:ubiquitin ligase-binding protein bul1 n=1 Tax=Candida tenuis TaxID=2315449 RepID=UPI0027A93C06|nr:ubiquitin ligase-binding protein bul1 [Yamadazyma tenuis]